MAIRNNRSERIWRAVRRVLLVFAIGAALLLLLNVMGMVLYLPTGAHTESETVVVEADEIVE